MAMSRSFGGTSLTTRSPMRISPAVMFSSPAIMRSSVDLPQPDGPTSTTNSPSAMSISTPWMTSVAPKALRDVADCDRRHSFLPAARARPLSPSGRSMLQPGLMKSRANAVAAVRL